MLFWFPWNFLCCKKVLFMFTNKRFRRNLAQGFFFKNGLVMRKHIKYVWNGGKLCWTLYNMLVNGCEWRWRLQNPVVNDGEWCSKRQNMLVNVGEWFWKLQFTTTHHHSPAVFLAFTPLFSVSFLLRFCFLRVNLRGMSIVASSVWFFCFCVLSCKFTWFA